MWPDYLLTLAVCLRRTVIYHCRQISPDRAASFSGRSFLGPIRPGNSVSAHGRLTNELSAYRYRIYQLG
jgi:hypothetical protein